MPRRDGFDTNREMQADFTDSARRFYIAAFIGAMDIGFPPEVVDKPIPFIEANATRHIGNKAKDLASSIKFEVLSVTPLGTESDLYHVPDLGPEEPQEAVAYKEAVRTHVEQAVASDDLDIEKILVPGTVFATYAAHDGISVMPRRLTTSVDPRASKINLAAAKVIAEDALTHVEAEGVDFDIIRGAIELIIEEKDIIVVSLHNIIHPLLPLNGHEPRKFLEEFLETMKRSAKHTKDHIDRMVALGYPSGTGYLETEKQRYENAVAAAKRASDILGRK